MRLHHVQLLIPPGREDVARGFYAGVLGLGEVEKPPEPKQRGGYWFWLDQLELHPSPVDDFQPATRAHPAQPRPVGGQPGLIWPVCCVTCTST